MMEIKDQEITLDDLYSLNLSKLDEWKCIIPVCVIFLTTFFGQQMHNYILLLITIDNVSFVGNVPKPWNINKVFCSSN